MNANEKLYHAAAQFLGVREKPGKLSNPLILAWIKSAASWLDGDDSVTAWCGCFRGHLGVLTGTGVPPAHYRARNWLTWGRAVDVKTPRLWKQGDTIILKRRGGAHVALLREVLDKATITCLGGNQSNAVTIAPFKLSDVIGVRRATPC